MGEFAMQKQVPLINKINKASIEELNTNKFWQDAFKDLMSGENASDFILELLHFNNYIIDNLHQKHKAALEGSWRYISEQEISDDILNATKKFKNYESITNQLNNFSKNKQIINNLQKLLNKNMKMGLLNEIKKLSTVLENVVNQEQEQENGNPQDEEEKQGENLSSTMQLGSFRKNQLNLQPKQINWNNQYEEEMPAQKFQNISLQPKAAKKEISGLKELYKKILQEAELDHALDNSVLKKIHGKESDGDHKASIQLMKQVKEIHDDIAQHIIDHRQMPFNLNQQKMQNDVKVLNFIIETLYNNKVDPELLFEAGYDSKTFQTFLETRDSKTFQTFLEARNLKINELYINNIIKGIDQYTETLCKEILKNNVKDFPVHLLLRANKFITDETNIVDQELKANWTNRKFLEKIMTYFADVIAQCENIIEDKQNVFLKALAPNEPAVLQFKDEAKNELLEDVTKNIGDIFSFQSTNSFGKETFGQQSHNTLKLNSNIDRLYYDLQPQKSLEKNMQTLYNNILADETCIFKGVGNSRNYSGDVFKNQIRAHRYSDVDLDRKKKFTHDALQLMHKIKEFKKNFKGSAEIIENVDKVFDAIFIQFNDKNATVFKNDHDARLSVYDLSHDTKFAGTLKIKLNYGGGHKHDPWFISEDDRNKLDDKPDIIKEYYEHYQDIGNIDFEDSYRDAIGQVQEF